MATDKKKAASEPEEKNSVKEAGENWPDNAPDSVKEYEELRQNPPEEQKHLYEK